MREGSEDLREESLSEPSLWAVQENLRLRECVSGAALTTFRIGGEVRYLFEPDTLDELKKGLGFIHSCGEAYRVLGGGSNVLLPDDGISSWVIRLGKGFRFWENTSERGCFFVGGSMPLMRLSAELSQAGWSGLEFAGGIPAWFGGAVCMNAGAHGSETASILEEVFVLDGQGNEHRLSVTDLPFAYRHSGLSPELIVYGATLRLVEGDSEKISSLRARCLAERKARQPLSFPSAGSVFRNPSPECSAGFLLEQVGMKGEKEGGAEVSPLHANWILNPKRCARAADVCCLIERCQKIVHERKGVMLEPEVLRW